MGATISRLRSPSPKVPPPPPSPPSELASLPENVLAEIFVNLPPHPENLRSVSLGSHQFRDIVTNRPFLRRFHAQHGDMPPLLGFFCNEKTPRFLPTEASSKSDHTAADAGALEPLDAGWIILSTCHGRVLLQSPFRRRLLVVDPMLGRRKYIGAPAGYKPKYQSNAALLCVPGDADCRYRAFRIMFVYFCSAFVTPMYIYSSETAGWVKVEFPDTAPQLPIDVIRPCVRGGDVTYWQSIFASILAINANTHELRQIPTPVHLHWNDSVAWSNSNVVAPKHGSLGFIQVSFPNLQLWVSNFVNGVHVEWIPLMTVRLDNLLPLRGATMLPQVRIIIGYDEDENVVYLCTKVGVFGLQLDTMKPNKLLDNCGSINRVYPYKSFFITAVCLDGSSGSDDIGNFELVGNVSEEGSPSHDNFVPI